MICVFGVIPIYILLQRYGPGMRAARPMYMKRLDATELGVAVNDEVVNVNGGALEIKSH